MFVETIKNRSSPPCTLLRESYRDEGKVRHRTIANLSSWPDDLVFGLRELLKNHRTGNPVTPATEGFRIERSIPHGHVQAVVGTIERLKLDHLIGSKRCPERDRVIAMIAARILTPGSKLATTRALNAASRSNTLAEACGIDGDVHENDLYDAMDWLLKRQARIDEELRPINHYNPDRVRCHIFLCMLAYYVEWHMRQALKPLLFDEDDPEAARLARTDVVSPKEPSPSARAKANGKKTPDGLPVHSFQTLLDDLATLTRNTIVPKLAGAPGWQQDTEPTVLQTKIIELLANHPMP